VTRSKLVIPAVVAVAALAAFWFLALAPKREQVAKLDKDIAAQDAAAAQSELLAATYLRAKERYRVNYRTLASLGKAVPADDDVRSLLVQIADAAERSKVSFESLNVVPSGVPAPDAATAASTGAPAPAPGTVAVGSAGFSAMPFTFSFSGRYFRLSSFLQRLERFVTVQNEKIGVTGRLLLLGSIAVAPDGEDPGTLQAKISAATYLVPPTQGVPGAATPAAGAAPGGTTPAAGDQAVPNTTATITGVR
jgi:Tfp pilus assembly protein PilO